MAWMNSDAESSRVLLASSLARRASRYNMRALVSAAPPTGAIQTPSLNRPLVKPLRLLSTYDFVRGSLLPLLAYHYDRARSRARSVRALRRRRRMGSELLRRAFDRMRVESSRE